MATVRLSPRAVADYDDIMDYLAQSGGPEVVNSYAVAFERTFDHLVQFPGLGSRRPRLGKHVRIIPLLPYSIFYDGEPKGDSVLVLRILRGSRNITRRLLSEGRGN